MTAKRFSHPVCTSAKSARSRAREQFDWPVVVEQYAQLFDELGARRAMPTASVPDASLNPLRGDPFNTFAALAVHTMRLE